MSACHLWACALLIKGELIIMGRSVETGSAKPEAVIFYAGDSTVQFNCIDTYPQTGLGQVLPRFLKEIYPVSNHGKNGRSTKSFIDEGRLDVISGEISEGDFLFIQFGHNDEKESDSTRYTRAFFEYKDNLKKFINCARKAKAFPILITPIERCHFKDGILYEGLHDDYVMAMKEVADSEKVPCIDLYSVTRKIMSELGEDESLKFYMPDGTHLTVEGAIRYARFIADGLRRLGDMYGKMVIDEF